MEENLPPTNNFNIQDQGYNLLDKLNPVVLINNNSVDLFINQKLLEHYGITSILCFKSATVALDFLIKTNIKYQLILIDIYLPVMDGFGFIDKFNEFKLYRKHGEACLLSASLNPLHKKEIIVRKIKFIEKPLTIDKICQII